jgi:hypothetical protein
VIILFFHVPKTAGSSIKVAVQSALSRAYTIVVEDALNPRLPLRLQRLAKRPETFFVQGHITPSLELLSIPMRRVTVLREPFDRLISHFCYCFDRRFYDLAQLDFFRSRKNYSRNILDGEDLIAWIARFNMDDFQVRFLSGEYDRKVTDKCLTRAITTLSSFDCVATTENLAGFFNVVGRLTRRTYDVDRLPHANKSDRTRLRLSPEDQQHILREFCQKDIKLLQAVMAREDQMDGSVMHDAETIEKIKFWQAGRIVQLLSPNTTVHEVLFRIKRKSLGIATQSMEIMGNLVSRG